MGTIHTINLGAIKTFLLTLNYIPSYYIKAYFSLLRSGNSLQIFIKCNMVTIFITFRYIKYYENFSTRTISAVASLTISIHGFKTNTKI